MIAMPASRASAGPCEHHLAAVHAQRAAIGEMHAGEDLDERRLAGPVLAHEPVDLAADELDRDVGERVDRTEALGRVLE